MAVDCSLEIPVVSERHGDLLHHAIMCMKRGLVDVRGEIEVGVTFRVI
jgi:hypothetical protein